MQRLFLLCLVVIIPAEGINQKRLSAIFHIETSVPSFSKGLVFFFFFKFHFIERTTED